MTTQQNGNAPVTGAEQPVNIDQQLIADAQALIARLEAASGAGRAAPNGNGSPAYTVTDTGQLVSDSSEQIADPTATLQKFMGQTPDGQAGGAVPPAVPAAPSIAPVAPAAPQIDTDALVQQQEIEQRELGVMVRETQGRVQSQAGQLYNERIQAGYTTAQAQDYAQMWAQEQYNKMDLVIQAHQARNSSSIRSTMAATLSAQSGLPVEHLLQFPDEQSMKLAADGHAAVNREVQALRQEMAQMRGQVSRIGAPAQQFEGNGGQGGMSIQEEETLFGMGMVGMSPRLQKFYEDNGF